MKYRENGGIGAILDEYERAILDLKTLISPIGHDALTYIVDPHTKDPDCRSIQTILSHVVRSGYTYAILVHKKLGEEIDFIERQSFKTTNEYCQSLDTMFAYNEQLFQDNPMLNLESFHADDIILSNCQTHYDLEQLYEHAIVHILRHRRQIERFMLKIKTV